MPPSPKALGRNPRLAELYSEARDKEMADESKMFRLRVGDKVAWNDTSEFPPVQYEGEVTGFDNEELTYLKVSLKNVADEKAKAEDKVLTEDEVTRIG